VDVSRLNSRFVELLTRNNVDWTDDVVSNEYCNYYAVNKKVAVEKLKIDLIVLRSKAVDLLIFLPFIVLSLLILSRSQYFDHWHTPILLIIVILFGAIIAMSSAFRLRRSAAIARNHALENLEKILKYQQIKECKQESPVHNANEIPDEQEITWRDHKMSERIKEMMEDIKNIKEGPFLPIARHPVISALAMPFGGVGGLYLIDYLTNAGI
jgi:hypothetical protein